jgi:hypothetical protein
MQQTAVNFASHEPSSGAGSTVGLALISLVSVHAGLEVLVAGVLMMSLVMAPEAASRALAKLCSALSAARSPAVPSVADLIHVAQEAFVGALQRGIGFGAAVATSAAVLTVHFLRKAREAHAHPAPTGSAPGNGQHPVREPEPEPHGPV